MAEQRFESQNSWPSKSLPVTARPPCLATGTQLRACPEGRGGEGEGQDSREAREPATYFVLPSSQASDPQPGMKPGSLENHRPTSARKQSRTLASAKDTGPSFLYSSRSAS